MKNAVWWAVVCDVESVAHSDWSIQLKRTSSKDRQSALRAQHPERERERGNIFTDIFFNHSFTRQPILNFSNLSSQIAMDCRNVSEVRVYLCTASKINLWIMQICGNRLLGYSTVFAIFLTFSKGLLFKNIIYFWFRNRLLKCKCRCYTIQQRKAT